jgi:small subunit ribosomal protein S5
VIDRNNQKFDKDRRASEYEERVVEISRVSRVVKGGRRIRFRILVVIGDQKGKIGYGMAKATEIAVGVKKAVAQAKKHMITVPIINDTIPYQVMHNLGSAKVFLKPASQGTSIVAGGVIRVVADLAGIKNLLSKVIGTSNKINNVKAVFEALSSFDQKKVEIMKKRFEAGQKAENPIAEKVEKTKEEVVAEKEVKEEAVKKVQPKVDKKIKATKLKEEKVG